MIEWVFTMLSMRTLILTLVYVLSGSNLGPSWIGGLPYLLLTNLLLMLNLLLIVVVPLNNMDPLNYILMVMVPLIGLLRKPQKQSWGDFLDWWGGEGTLEIYVFACIIAYFG